MMNVLDQILLQKKKEVAALKKQAEKNPDSSLNRRLKGVLKRVQGDFFSSALSQSGLSVIAEIKRKSPSKGCLSDISDPVFLAKAYESGGAAAISVLTDFKFFGGTLNDLMQVKANIKLPVMRKDFIIDEIQIAEAVEAGADAVLLMVSVLGNQLSKFLACACEMGIEALVEVHNVNELKIASQAGAKIIGVNHRDLFTFNMDMDLGLEMIDQMDSLVIKVAESGIDSAETAKEFYMAGFNAVLIGEALVKSENAASFIRQCCEG